MTAIFVLNAGKPQPHLVKRRYAYKEHIVGSRYFYLREEHNSPHLIRRDKDRIQIKPECIEDIRSLHSDPTATVFAVEQNHSEPIEAMLVRGQQLPLSMSSNYWCQLNKAQYQIINFLQRA